MFNKTSLVLVLITCTSVVHAAQDAAKHSKSHKAVLNYQRQLDAEFPFRPFRLDEDDLENLGKSAPDLEACGKGLVNCAQKMGTHVQTLKQPAFALMAAGMLVLMWRVSQAVQYS